MNKGYTCHAHPVELNGKECGHYNSKPKKDRLNLTFCESCGRTKIASDSRKRRAK